MTNAEAMNSVTEKKQRRRFILTKHVMAGIPVLVQQGNECRSHRSPTWLQSRHVEGPLLASGHQPARAQRGQCGADRAAGASVRSAKATKAKAVICLCRADHTATQQSYDVPAAPAGGSNRMTESELVMKLPEVIVQDDLFDAV